MNLEQLIGLLKIGHEIEFTYKGERYSRHLSYTVLWFKASSI